MKETVGLVLNTGKENAVEVGKKVINWLDANNICYLIEKNSARLLHRIERKADYERLKREASMVILFGGDGTFLHTAHHFFGTSIPLLGINLGKLGFLTEIETDELIATLNLIKENKYEIEERMVLEAAVIRNGKKINENYALNDVVFNRGANARMVTINLFINDQFVNSYRADGLIIATPTGSTAYSLSAGGPIINPQIRAILVTPICPHTLYVRPMVISEKEKLKIVISGDNKEMKLTSDGSEAFSLITGDQIVVTASQKKTSLVKLPGRTFYTILHEKMRGGLV